jgi:membrane dipeptidase
MMKFPVVDGHCDSIMSATGRSLAPGESGRRDLLSRNAAGHLDLPRLREGGYACQAMAIFCEDEEVAEGRAASVTDAMLDELEAILAASGGAFAPVRRAADIQGAMDAGAVGALASIEGGECLGGRLGELGRYHGRGVRMIGLTWNRRNELGRGLFGEGSGGLTEFGLAVVREAARLGMVVDCSHLSDEAFDDLARASERPFVASHSNCRALCSFPRNLDDGRIEAVARSGGLVGVNAVPDFVADGGGRGANLAKLCDHIDHIVAVGGIGCAALGMDFDGYDPAQGGPLADCSRVQEVAAELGRRGYSEGDVALVMGGNWMRVFAEVIG